MTARELPPELIERLVEKLTDELPHWMPAERAREAAEDLADIVLAAVYDDIMKAAKDEERREIVAMLDSAAAEKSWTESMRNGLELAATLVHRRTSAQRTVPNAEVRERLGITRTPEADQAVNRAVREALDHLDGTKSEADR